MAGAVRAKLDKSQYKDVQVSVDANGMATLTGTVSLYEYKSDADKTTHKVKGVTAVRNDIASRRTERARQPATKESFGEAGL